MSINPFEESTALDSDVPLEILGYNEMPEYLQASLHKNKRPEFSTISPETKRFMRRHFPHVSDEQWNSWRWQIKNSYTSFSQLYEIVDFKRKVDDEDMKVHEKLPLRITPYYASLLEGADPESPIVKGVVPSYHELIQSPGEASDPLHEENCSPVPNIVHRYPDRVYSCNRILLDVLPVLHAVRTWWQKTKCIMAKQPGSLALIISGRIKTYAMF
jgi:hypothetical protein